ncbi:VapC toxin family PIN domain ribonuclease [Candidatus Bathyarchaeota archaeon]|nr:MAG: VapC toxin family PIN domain ribonuclease [Candidatus Bathyarchaeota archaeon]
MEEEGDLRYLIDASALYTLLKRKRDVMVEIIDASAIIDLTKYEIGNALWVEWRRGLIEDPKRTMRGWMKLLSFIREIQLDKGELDEVEDLALELSLPFYDASYIYIAKRMGLTLLTDDVEMRDKAAKLGVKTLTTVEFLKTV